MSDYKIHWDEVEKSSESILFALWPAPVNHDTCFKEAGFTDFEDPDSEWETSSFGVFDRLWRALSSLGEPRRQTPPFEVPPPWYKRLLGVKTRSFTLAEEMRQTLQDDNLPGCVVAFGSSGIQLQTGAGHHLFWLTFPSSSAGSFLKLVGKAANGYPVTRIKLKWEILKPQNVRRGHRQ